MDDDETTSATAKLMHFPSDGSLFSESSILPDRLQPVIARRRELVNPQRSAMSELWKPLRKMNFRLEEDGQTKSEPPHKVARQASTTRAMGSLDDRMYRKLHGISLIGDSSITRDCSHSGLERSCRESAHSSCCQVKLEDVRVSSCSEKRNLQLSSLTRTDDCDDDMLERLGDPAACTKLSLSELRPSGKLRTSDMFLGQGGRNKRAEVREVVRVVTIWILVLSGTGTIMFGAVGTIVMRSVTVMFFGSMLGSALTTVGVLMAIYCTDGADRNLRMMNPRYNYT